MAYHVKFDNETKEILAGTMNKNGTKFINSTIVTGEALEAIKNHFVALSLARNEDLAFAWQYDNGKTLVMKFEVVDSALLKEEKQE